MIEDIVLSKDEFKSLDLRMVGTYANSIGTYANLIIYAGDVNGVCYLLTLEHDEGVGTYYKGSKLTRLEPLTEHQILKNRILLDIQETADKHKQYNLNKKKVKWDGCEDG